MILNSEKNIAKIHALYVLEGLNELNVDFLIKASKSENSDLTSHTIVLLERYVSERNAEKAIELFEELNDRADVQTDLYLLSTLGRWLTVDQKFFTTMVKVLNRHQREPIFRVAALSGLEGEEIFVKESLAKLSSYDDRVFIKKMNEVIAREEEGSENPIYTREFLVEDTRTRGAKLFYEICASCHGPNGNGIEGLAPPLMSSEHVANAQRLGLIILHGLEGPITVKGKQYDLNLAMPGLIRNDEITDDDIASIIAYVTNAFSDEPKLLKAEEIAKFRKAKPKSGTEYTLEELLNYSVN